jgi:hypothetical protein
MGEVTKGNEVKIKVDRPAHAHNSTPIMIPNPASTVLLYFLQCYGVCTLTATLFPLAFPIGEACLLATGNLSGLKH